MEQKEKTLRPKPPLTTSKLQQMAATRLGFTSRKTMQVAQGLYEGVNIGESRVGLITYMRTDSTRISETALEEVRAFIAREVSPGPAAGGRSQYAPAKRAQDAHEAIRPTYVTYTPAEVEKHLSGDEHKLYSLIWESFVSCQMNPARTRTTTVGFKAGEGLFRASSTQTLEPGFQRVLKVLASKEGGKLLPPLEVGETVENAGFHPEQHFTTGPARYTDATIIKVLEENGIGRPSTYAPIISVLLDRYYVQRRNRQLVPTQLGRIINDMLTSSFPDIVDEQFTAQMEQRLDEVEEHREAWAKIIGEFYTTFKPKVDHVMETLESIKGVMDEPTEYTCEKCGRPMIKKLGRFGHFLACSGFPGMPLHPLRAAGGLPAPGCGGKIIARRKQGGRGKEFYGCTNYPNCDFVTHYKPTNSKCPQVRLPPGGEGRQAAGALQVLHQPGVQLPAYPGGRGPECLSDTWSTSTASATSRPTASPPTGGTSGCGWTSCSPAGWRRSRRAARPAPSSPTSPGRSSPRARSTASPRGCAATTASSRSTATGGPIPSRGCRG